MNVLLFPGQGSQVVGMGLEFFNKFKIVKELFAQADEKLKFKISKVILDGPEDQLKLTQNTQPAILIVSYSIFSVLKHNFGLNPEKFKFFAGHSLGEYSALVCSQSLNFDDAIYLLRERGKAMQTAVPLGQGSMIAVLGTQIDDVKNIIKETNFQKGTCEVANDNADGQVILSGDSKSIDLIKIKLKEKKIKTIPLKVSAPFHCSLMRPAAKIMEEKINKTNFEKPLVEIVNNVTATVENTSNIKKLLVDQIFSTVKWRESLIYMSDNNVKNFIEIGPGKTLSGMVKRTLKDVNSFSINSIADIEKLNDEFKR